jgi:hypothetical protein
VLPAPKAEEQGKKPGYFTSKSDWSTGSIPDLAGALNGGLGLGGLTATIAAAASQGFADKAVTDALRDQVDGTFGQAMKLGSAEAAGSVLRAKYGRGGDPIAKSTADSTKKTAAATVDLAKAFKTWANKQAPIPVFDI